MGPKETIEDRFRELGIDAATVLDAGATIRATPATPGEVWTTPEELPRISIDLPSTLSGTSDRPTAVRPGRPELEIQQILGEGGMGRVFLARQRSLDREVAIKTLRDQASPRDYDALLLEGAVTGHLEHPAIIPVHALGMHDDGRPVLVMKRVDGVSWRALLDDPKHAAWEGFGGDPTDRLEGHLEILMQVCNAVGFAHSRGIAHRDIKPENVLIGRFGDVYLADWGIAHRFDKGPAKRLCGTPAYMAPEMARGGTIDARTDVYLLGATLHQLLTGKLRHEGATIYVVLMDAVESPPFEYDSSVPADLAALANRATAANPDDRPASAAEFRKALADHLRHKSSTVLAKSALPRLARLRELLASPDAQHEVDRLVAEVRFALSQAIEQWEGNADARRAMNELEEVLETRRARIAELERIARDHDPAVGVGPRTFAVVALAVAAMGLFVAALVRGPRAQPTPQKLFEMSLLPSGAALLIMLVFRKHLMSSSINRHTIVVFLAATLGITASRGLSLQLGATTPMMLVHDCVLAAALSAFSIPIVSRWLSLPTVWLLATGLVCATHPEYAHFAFNFAMSATILLCAFLARRTTPFSR